MDSAKIFFDVWTNNASNSDEKPENKNNLADEESQNKAFPFTPAQWYVYYFMPWINDKKTLRYLKEIWKPIDKIANSNAVGIESISKILNTDKYQQILNDMFSFEMYEELKNKTKTSTENYWKYWIEQGWQSISFFSKSLQGLFFKPNKDENIDNSLPFKDFIQNYTNKITDLQHFFFQIGIKSIEKTAEKILAEMPQKKVKFDDFYKIWLDIIRKDIQNSLLGEKFNQIWNEIVQIAEKINLEANKLLLKNKE
ncbi:MAG: hypothetical protein EAZ85_05590 [Bacteroidetes bacterium]|nr:MAG: hypothetical protein EAZ85_05590 [Bacteroidota bacterium]TAG89284.1 MAG: hypothetical protein EAZ20_06860 [Bacteroidota bacterium]